MVRRRDYIGSGKLGRFVFDVFQMDDELVVTILWDNNLLCVERFKLDLAKYEGIKNEKEKQYSLFSNE